jgi:hypothetical protein
MIKQKELSPYAKKPGFSNAKKCSNLVKPEFNASKDFEQGGKAGTSPKPKLRKTIIKRAQLRNIGPKLM